jgi:uncharacterized protein (DUF362 family)/NAD-dependent dihydropyrimidine dehydrogenase PreA subunit
MSIPVSIVKCKDYSSNEVDAAVKQAIELVGGLNANFLKGSRVLLKPNILSVSGSETGINTHPAVVQSVIKYIKDAGGEPLVADASGFVSSTNDALKISGILDVCQKEGIDAHPFTKDGFEEVQVQDGEIFKTLYVAKDVVNADFIISLPKLKTHVQAKYTGAIKNFFGVIPQKQRKHLHRMGTFKSLSAGIVDIYSVVKPDFVLMDAIVSMDGNGPSKGDLRQTGLILASPDCVALDSVVCRMIGFKDGEVLYIDGADKRNLGQSNLSKIDVVGGKLSEFNVRFKKPRIQGGNVPSFMIDFVFYLYKKEPVVDKSKCQACGYCVKVCPTSAIILDDVAHIISDDCIECYCCYEVCPHEVIDLKRSFIYKLMSKIKGRKV